MNLPYSRQKLEKIQKTYRSMMLAYLVFLAPITYLVARQHQIQEGLAFDWLKCLRLYAATAFTLEAVVYLAGGSALKQFKKSSIDLYDDHLIKKKGKSEETIDFRGVSDMSLLFFPDGSLRSILLKHEGRKKVITGYENMEQIVATIEAHRWDTLDVGGAHLGPHLQKPSKIFLFILAGGMLVSLAVLVLADSRLGHGLVFPLIQVGLGLYLVVVSPLSTIFSRTAQYFVGGLLTLAGIMTLAIELLI